MKTFVSVLGLIFLVCALVEARPKRSVIVGAPLVAASPVVASVPVVHTASVVRSHPTTVVKTEQVHDGAHSSYSYSSEVKSEPVVHHTHTHTHAAVAAAPVAAVTTVHHTVPTHYAYYPASYSYYSPYHYVVGK